MRGAFRKEFRDRFEVELALFELTVAFERHAQELRDPEGARGRLLDELRGRVVVTTRLPLAEIAASCGFADATHFGKVFRRMRHQSPAVYRRSLA